MLRTRKTRGFLGCKASGNLMNGSRIPVIFGILSAGVLLALVPLSASADSLPSQPAPTGFVTVNSGSGGRILSGPLPDVTSPQDALRAGLHKLSGYFGETLQVTGAVRSKDGQTTTAFFQANFHGTPITGVSIVALAPKGGGREAILFDNSAGFSKTLPSLTERLKSLPLPTPPKPHATAAAALHVAIPTLHPQHAADGTIGISIPSDWKILSLGDGRAFVQGPKAQLLLLNLGQTFIEAGSQRAQMAERAAQFTHTRMQSAIPIAPYSPDIAQAYTNAAVALAQSRGFPDPEVHIEFNKPGQPGFAYIGGTRTDQGVNRRFMGLATARQGVASTWTLETWMMSSPTDDFKQNAPIMLAIENSMTYNAAQDRKVKAQETAMIIAQSKADMARSKAEHENFEAAQNQKFRSAMAADRAAQDSIDRSAAGMIHVIQGTSVLAHTPTGYHGNIDANVAQSIAEQDPQHFQVVQMKDYVKGVDY